MNTGSEASEWLPTEASPPIIFSQTVALFRAPLVYLQYLSADRPGLYIVDCLS